MLKLGKSFYQKSAEKIAKDFLGKYLVFNSPKGRVSGKIIEVEAYPAFKDNVSHGNKKTERTKVMYKEGGYVYVYLVYGMHHQFAVVVNKKGIPEVVFVRALIPTEGIDIMKRNFKKPVKKTEEFTKSPGNLCKSFGITLDLYGEDLTKDKLFIEDRGETVDKKEIVETLRVGISKKLKGYNKKLRYILQS